MDGKTHKFIFGVFEPGGKLHLLIGRTHCTHKQASIIVSFFDLAEQILEPNDYFAYDYAKSHNLQSKKEGENNGR